MKHRRMHGLEKIQVELAAIAALLAVYFWLGPGLLPADPLEAVVMLPFGDWARAGRLVLLLLGLGAFCAAVTISSRREGALLAVLIGAGGVSLLSPQIRSVLWMQGPDVERFYVALIAEVAVLWCGLAISALFIDLVQGVLTRLRPSWAWRSPLEGPGQEELPAERAAADPSARPVPASRPSGRSLVWDGLYRRASGQPAPAGRRHTPGSLFHGLYSAATGLILSVVLLHVLLKTSDRGQILFSLAASFTVGTLIANQLVPAAHSLFAWVPPALAAVFFYSLAALAGPHPSPTQSWTAVVPAACPLPIDWLTAGAGGSVLGYWISCRLHELRFLERQEKTEAEAR